MAPSPPTAMPRTLPGPLPASQANVTRFNHEESAELVRLVAEHGPKWKAIGEELGITAAAAKGKFSRLRVRAAGGRGPGRPRAAPPPSQAPPLQRPHPPRKVTSYVDSGYRIPRRAQSRAK